MGRVLAGAAAAICLIGAAIVLIMGREKGEAMPAAPAEAPGAPLPLLGDPQRTAEPPSANARTREEKRFNRYDKDKNGTVTVDEYFASRKKAFIKLDSNGDGRLSFDEWAIKGREKFAKADADRSQGLSRTEFATTAPVRKPRPKPKCDCPQTPEAVAGEEEQN